MKLNINLLDIIKRIIYYQLFKLLRNQDYYKYSILNIIHQINLLILLFTFSFSIPLIRYIQCVSPSLFSMPISLFLQLLKIEIIYKTFIFSNSLNSIFIIQLIPLSFINYIISSDPILLLKTNQNIHILISFIIQYLSIKKCYYYLIYYLIYITKPTHLLLFLLLSFLNNKIMKKINLSLYNFSLFQKSRYLYLYF